MCDEAEDEEEGMDEPSSAKRPSVLTIDRAAFLLLRVKRAFKKKRQQRKEKHAAAAAAAAAEALGGGGGGGGVARRVPPPLLRSRTLPAIVAPGFSILQAQIDPQRSNDLTQSQLLCRGVSAHKVCGLRAHAPRISFTSKDESETHEQRRKSASSRLGSSPRTSIASEERVDSLALKVPTPRGSVSSTSSSSAGSRLARLLTQGVRGGGQEDVANHDAPRRLSWERRESFGQLPRSASIDSMVEAAICARHSEPSQPVTLQLPGRADRALSLVSPAVGRRAKSQRGLADDFGRYQLVQFILHVVSATPTAIHILSLVTVAGVPDHRCAVQGIDSLNYTEPWNSSQLLNAIPLDDQGSLDSCKIYGANKTLIECHRWVYDTKYYTSSRGIEWNFVCGRMWMSTLAQTAFMCGVIVGSLVLAPLCDRYGRKIVYCWSATFQLISTITVAFMTEYYSFVALKFICGIFALCPFKAGFVLFVELIGPSKRTICAALYQVLFGVGVMLVGVWGYLIDNRFYLQIVYALHSAFLLPQWFLMDESPRWLWARGRVAESVAIVERALKFNRSSETVDTSVLLITDKTTFVQHSTQSTSIIDLFRTPNMLRKTLIISGSWFATALVFYGLSLNTGTLHGNPYLMLFISGLVEIPGYVITMSFLNRVGHRALLSSTLLLSGFCLVIVVGLPYKSTATTAAVMLGKCIISGSYAVIYKYGSELFPTVVRSSGVGLGTMCSSIATSLSPWIILMGSLNPVIPTTVFGFIAIIFGMCTMLLPETLGRRLPQTLEDGENFGIGDTCFSRCTRKSRNLNDASVISVEPWQ